MHPDYVPITSDLLIEQGFALVDTDYANTHYNMNKFDVFIQSDGKIVFAFEGHELKQVRYMQQVELLIEALSI